MRCLYCGKELALLKRLRGGGEFCSDAHKQSYQEEYNRLGLSRLLQARSRADESKGAQKPAEPRAPVAVAEQPVEEVAEELGVPVEEVGVDQAGTQPPPVEPAVIAAPPEPPPPAMAGFAMETPSISAPPYPLPYLELELRMSDETPAPAPTWRLEGPSVEYELFSLPSAGLVPLEMQPGVCESSYSVMDTRLTPRENEAPRVHLSMPLTVTSSHEFERGGSITIEILPRPSESSCYASLNGAVDFSYPVAVQVFDLLDLSPAGIAYPEEECDVTVPESWTNGMTNGIISDGPVDIIVPAIPHDIPAIPHDAPAIPVTAPVPEVPDQPAMVPAPAGPRAALEALSRLHQDMREREEAKAAAPVAESPLPATDATHKAPRKTSPPPSEPSPAREAELVAISVKSFAPPKASPVIDLNALFGNGLLLLPRLKALPLRAKMAPTPRGFSQPPKPAPAQTSPAQTTPAQTAAKGPQGSAPPAPVVAPSKPPVAGKPAQPPQTSKPAQAGEKTAQPQPVKKPAPAAEAAPAKQSAAATPAQAVQQPTETAKPPQQEQSTKPVPVNSASAPPTAQPSQAPPKAQPAAATGASPTAKSEPFQKAPAKTGPAEKAKAAAAASGPAAPDDQTVPNFGAVVNTSMFGSLKVKIGIAALVAVVSIGGYFMVSGKAKPSASPAKTSDVGMSIMVGEGGWVENWAGDPIGQHGGREITIYRPSLKLSDYRIEFQGQIDTKSIGWIFRAADPDNYYAMKLQLVSQELPLTVALYKYMVLKGRQVQVGRVPIDVPVKNDTVFSIRMDVRGPKFNTYVQGQPVDVWTDDQLRSGGVGFLNERSERSKIKSVSLSYLSGGTK
jgi:hypothetical protein